MGEGAITEFRDADAVKKLLDNGWHVSVFRNDLGSYTAFARPSGDCGKATWTTTATQSSRTTCFTVRRWENANGTALSAAETKTYFTPLTVTCDRLMDRPHGSWPRWL